jgi:hypothetical protein
VRLPQFCANNSIVSGLLRIRNWQDRLWPQFYEKSCLQLRIELTGNATFLILDAAFRRDLEKRPGVQVERLLAMQAQSAARQTPARRTAM